MKKNFFEIKYFETYYFANIINNILSNPLGFPEVFDSFFNSGVEAFLKPFPKQSRLHDFIIWAIETIVYEDIDADIDSIRKGKLETWVEYAYQHYKLDYYSLDEWCKNNNLSKSELSEDDLFEYFQELRITEPYDKLLTLMSEEIFFILFQNRGLLYTLNYWISNSLSKMEVDEFESDSMKLLTKKNFLKRSRIPVWVQKAVFFRDRGMCLNCKKDLTGLFNLSSNKNYDHIIPLAQGGINDVTNVQLLCESCNKSKKENIIAVSQHYEKWY
jgi:hypothetical protein